jgi:hypothetical protein
MVEHTPDSADYPTDPSLFVIAGLGPAIQEHRMTIPA